MRRSSVCRGEEIAGQPDSKPMLTETAIGPAVVEEARPELARARRDAQRQVAPGPICPKSEWIAAAHLPFAMQTRNRGRLKKVESILATTIRRRFCISSSAVTEQPNRRALLLL